jgi:hypothetical protein
MDRYALYHELNVNVNIDIRNPAWGGGDENW